MSPRKPPVLHPRTEALWRSRAVRDWYTVSDARPQNERVSTGWADTRWHQLIEVAGATGWPDLYWANVKHGGVHESGWIEFKMHGALVEPARLVIPWKPAQPIVLRWLAARQIHAGVLMYVRSRCAWLWVPAQHGHKWAIQVQAPNGFLLWPHTWGVGRVPPPWELPSPMRREPYDPTRFAAGVTYMVDGAPATARSFDADPRIVAHTWETMRTAESKGRRAP